MRRHTGSGLVEPPDAMRDLVGVSASPHMDESAETGAGSGRWWRVLVTLVEHKLAVVGLVVIGVFILFCFLGPVFYHTNQVTVQLGSENLSPSIAHPLGTDPLGYDVLGRLMAGGRITLAIGVVVALATTFLGTVWGALAGYMGGALDALMMRIVDTFLAIPVLFLLLFIATLVTPSAIVLIVVLAAISWLVPSRLVRAEALSLRTREFVAASRGFGASGPRILFRHLLPNAVGTIVVNGTLQVADAILAVAYLSFLGLGLPPPAATWGGMLSNGVNYILDGYWWDVWPAGVCIVLLVVSINFLGDGLRDALEVRLQSR